MSGLWTLVTFAAVLAVLPVVRRVAIAVFAGRSIGDRALAKQPDRIHLVLAGDGAWTRPETVEPHAQALLQAGFRDAGTHTVDEMPGLVLRLLVEPAEAWMGVIYEHPQAGQWVEIAQQIEGGGGHTVSSLEDPGLDPRPGYTIEHLVRAPVGALIARMKAHTPSGTPLWMSTDQAAARFEQAYAEAIAWRKAHGVSRREVVKVAMKKAA